MVIVKGDSKTKGLRLYRFVPSNAAQKVLFQLASLLSVLVMFVKGCLAMVLPCLFVRTRKPANTATSEVHCMRALLLKAYGTDVALVEGYPRPKVVMATDVLIRVYASSVNPIDNKNKMGYGRKLLTFLRRKAKFQAGDKNEFPIILGRDCSGVVEAVGESVSRVKVGDETPGGHADYALADEALVSMKPQGFTHAEMASLAYSAATTWGALVRAAGLGPDTTVEKRVLILAGTGGIGSFAIQLVKAWGGHVTTSCSTSGRQMVEELGADYVVDYTQTDLETALAGKPRFDVVLDTIGPPYQPCLNLVKRGGCLVSIVSTALSTVDTFGFLLGAPKAAFDYLRIAIPQKLFFGRSFKYGFAYPHGDVLDVVARLMEEEQIKPIVEKVFNLEDGHQAMEHVRQGHSRGKTVLVMKKGK